MHLLKTLGKYFFKNFIFVGRLLSSTVNILLITEYLLAVNMYFVHLVGLVTPSLVSPAVLLIPGKSLRESLMRLYHDVAQRIGLDKLKLFGQMGMLTLFNLRQTCLYPQNPPLLQRKKQNELKDEIIQDRIDK